MKTSQNPFSLYDFLGYFIPGAAGIYSIIIIDAIYRVKISYEEICSLFEKKESFGIILLFLIISYILGHILNYFSTLSIEKYGIWKYCYPSKYLLKIEHDGFWGKGRKKIQKVWRITMCILLFPIVIFDFIIGYVFGLNDVYTKPLDNLLIYIIRRKKRILLNSVGITNINEHGKINELDFFRIIHHFAFEHSKQHQTKMQNYVILYGFLRTLALLFTILLWIIIFNGFRNGFYDRFDFYFTILVMSFIIYLLFMGYLKFFRRYTLEGFMALVAIKDNDINDKLNVNPKKTQKKNKKIELKK